MNSERPRTGSQDRTIEDALVFLDLTRLLDDVAERHPEISAPLRLTLLRAHRENAISWLDQDRFRDVVDHLARLEPTSTAVAS